MNANVHVFANGFCLQMLFCKYEIINVHYMVCLQCIKQKLFSACKVPMANSPHYLCLWAINIISRCDQYTVTFLLNSVHCTIVCSVFWQCNIQSDVNENKNSCCSNVFLLYWTLFHSIATRMMLSNLAQI